MTSIEFKNQWDTYFAPYTNIVMPNYDEYRICERMIEDYLDIFRGYNTREEGMDMPYTHPFFDSVGGPLLAEKPEIRYVLIGEACPGRKPPLNNSCQPIPGDEGNGYFYDVRHINKAQPWLSAPRINWACPIFRPCPTNKIQTLLCLAKNGVLLLDLFPFAIQINSILRAILNGNGITRLYWDSSTNIYNLKDRITRIAGLLGSDWDLTMVAPCLISEHIVNPLNGFPTLTIMPAGLHPHTFRTLLPDNTRCNNRPGGNEWKKIAVSQQSPTAHLIGLSFV